MFTESRSAGCSASDRRPIESDRQSMRRPSSLSSASGMKSRSGTKRPVSSMMRISPS